MWLNEKTNKIAQIVYNPIDKGNDYVIKNKRLAITKENLKFYEQFYCNMLKQAHERGLPWIESDSWKYIQFAQTKRVQVARTLFNWMLYKYIQKTVREIPGRIIQERNHTIILNGHVYSISIREYSPGKPIDGHRGENEPVFIFTVRHKNIDTIEYI
jgi:hypothetical protein